jgi:phosphate-selective porin
MRSHRLALLAVVAAASLAAGAGAEEPAPASVAWKDGKTTVELQGAQLSLSNRIQIRFTSSDAEGDERIGSFRLRRARTSLDGWLYKKELQFELMVDWVDQPLLEDLALNWDVSKSRALQFKVGQFKVPFGRQELTSDTAQQFVDRSIVSGEFEKGRDQGLQLWGLLGKGRVEYRAGVFNGNGRGRSANDNDSFQYDARLMFQPWGDARYSEGDLESAQRPLLALAANVERNDARPAAVRREVFGTDVSFKYRGLSLMGELFRRRVTPAAAASYASNGYHAQLGYFVKPRTLELALRYASFDPSGRVAEDGRREKGIALNYLYKKHLLKLQADFRRLTDEAKGDSFSELRTQVQFVF